MNIENVPKSVGKDLEIRGWVWRKRESKDIVFLIMRDGEGILQCTIKENQPDFEKARSLSLESSAIIRGKITRDKRAPTGYEMKIRKLVPVQIAERYPIVKDQSTEFLLDMRHLWLRSRKMNLVMKVRAEVLEAARQYFKCKKCCW